MKRSIAVHSLCLLSTQYVHDTEWILVPFKDYFSFMLDTDPDRDVHVYPVFFFFCAYLVSLLEACGYIAKCSKWCSTTENHWGSWESKLSEQSEEVSTKAFRNGGKFQKGKLKASVWCFLSRELWQTKNQLKSNNPLDGYNVCWCWRFGTRHCPLEEILHKHTYQRKRHRVWRAVT